MARGRCYTDSDGTPMRFPGVSLDITDRRAADARRVALAEIGDRLRDETDPGRMAYATAEVIGRTLNATRAGYGTVDPVRETIVIENDWNAPGIDSIAGLHHFREYGNFIEGLKRGETALIADVTTEPQTRASSDALLGLGIRALANVPLREHGHFVALCFLHDTSPRNWTTEEVIFVRNAADRLRSAIERVRAEERQRLLNQELSATGSRTRWRWCRRSPRRRCATPRTSPPRRCRCRSA